MELCLDTKGTCFLCLQEYNTDYVNNGNAQSNYKKETCLRNICRYLKIRPSAVLQKGLKGCLEKDGNDTGLKCEFSVTMCSNCCLVTEELSKLLKEQEMIKMLMEHHVKVFNQILKESENPNKVLWKQLKKKMLGNNENPVEAKLIEVLRDETKTQCKILHY